MQKREIKGVDEENMLRVGCGDKQGNEALSWKMIGISD